MILTDKKSKKYLDFLYKKYNRRDLVSPDPLQFLYEYEDVVDREVVGIIASSLAYGRVQQILKSVKVILDSLGDRPANKIVKMSDDQLTEAFSIFKHRFTTGEDIINLLKGLRAVLKEFGSLERCFCNGFDGKDYLKALDSFVCQLSQAFPEKYNYLLSSPVKKSACKRLNLFMRWMVRCDDVDPGGWSCVPKSMLLVPLDTHMNNVCTSFGLTNRKNADLKSVVQISEAFASIEPEDPIKYDFVLTRFGIRDDMDMNDLIKHSIK